MKNSIKSRLIHKIHFLTNNEFSEIKTANWQNTIEVFAEVQPVCDNRFISLENMQFGTVITEEYFLFTVRFIKEINKDMRIDFYGKIYEIKRIINENQRNKILKIIALEI
ncbi:MAG: head-tail adaptor protein [Rickettsiales bacterium]|nr:MAG: head-tail adaptor protein [Rickettsiales bacterium]